MKSITRFGRFIFVVLSFTALLLTGCGNDSKSSGTAFTANQVSGKSFAYSSAAGSTGTLTFNTDGTWSTTIGASSFSGSWSIDSNGKLVCVTTSGGNHTNTYTLLTTTTNTINTSVVEVNPADPTKPANYTATLTAVFTAIQMSGKTFVYSSASGSTGTLAFNADGTWNTTIGTSVFSGTWSINSNGKLVCVTTSGGNHTNTYTQLINNAADSLTTSVVEVNPSDPANPANYTATLTPAYTVNLTAFKLAAPGTQFVFSLTGSDNLGGEYTGSYTLISNGTTTFEGASRQQARQIFTTQRGNDAPLTSATTRYYNVPSGVFYKAVSDSGIVSIPASWNLPSGVIPFSAKVGEFGSVNTANNSDGTSYTFSWSLNADVNRTSQLVLSVFRTATSTISGGVEITTFYLDANGNPTGIAIFLRTDALRTNFSGNRE